MKNARKNLHIISPTVVHCLALRGLDGHLLEVFYVFSLTVLNN